MRSVRLHRSQNRAPLLMLGHRHSAFHTDSDSLDRLGAPPEKQFLQKRHPTPSEYYWTEPPGDPCFIFTVRFPSDVGSHHGKKSHRGATSASISKSSRPSNDSPQVDLSGPSTVGGGRAVSSSEGVLPKWGQARFGLKSRFTRVTSAVRSHAKPQRAQRFALLLKSFATFAS